jgi:hypothetical protein
MRHRPKRRGQDLLMDHRCFKNAMKPALLLIVLLLSGVAFGQEKHRRIGEVDFYGYGRLDLNEIRVALPLREGDDFPDSNDAFFNAVNRIREAVTRVIGKPPTDVAVVCCDAQGKGMIYIGLPGSSMRAVPYNPEPKGKIRLPAKIINLYQQTMEASSKAVLNGSARGDASKGFALSFEPDLRAKQLSTREYALRHERLVRSVLALSDDAEHRTVAAHILGYARQSKVQIVALVQASHDVNDSVRNDAIRALGVLAESSPKVADRIPAEGFVAMLSSGSWTDRNKAAFLLTELTKRRDPRLLTQLRSQALDSLIEMARWRSRGHADFARILLGRIAGIEETRLQQLVGAGRVDEVIEALKWRAFNLSY